jgi:predicted metal-dependent hydrolase
MLFSRFKKKPLKEKKYVVFNDTKVALTIFHEERQNNRVSIGKSGITVRLSNFFSENEKNEQIQKFLKWSFEKLGEKPQLLQNKARTYYNGMVLSLFDRELNIQLVEKNVKNGSAMLKNNELILVLPNDISAEVKQDTCSKLVTKILAKVYKPILWQKLIQFNEQYDFGKLNSIKLKNNASNWGSCSTRGNINISVRLLLANEDALNYVLIHELAHLRELNHSDKFWAWVKKACPNFKKHEVWLKQNSDICIL